MAETGITCRTFCNRLFKCSEYKESDDYAKMSRLLFEKILKTFNQNDSKSLIEIFTQEFTNKSFTGIRYVYVDHSIDYKTFCLNCITHLNMFFEEYNPTNIMNSYSYKYKIKGRIGCQIHKRIDYNVQFFFKDLKEMEKDLDFACINNYIYNQAMGLSNACIIMNVPTNIFYLLNYEEKDYTMGRGFFTQIKRHKLKRRGEHCTRCKYSCKPLYINGLDRLRTHL